MRISSLLATALIIFSGNLTADAIRQTKGDFRDAFRQLDVDLPTANVYRTASGAPGSQYWQQRADYKIKVHLDETRRRISAVALAPLKRSPTPTVLRTHCVISGCNWIRIVLLTIQSNVCQKRQRMRWDERHGHNRIRMF